MGLHPAFLLVTVVGWIFGVLGVAYHDEMVRDVGVLVAVASLSVGLLADSEALRAMRLRPVRSRVKAPRKEDVPPEPAVAEPAAAPAGEVVRPPLHSLPRSPPSWEADFAAPARAPAAAPEPLAVAPRANGGATVAPSSVAASVPAGADRLTRGICGKCQSPITVSSRRPIRVTCPMCGHSKLLQ